MAKKPKMAVSVRTSADRERLREKLRTIPDDTELSIWPLHSDQNCWCRPKVITSAEGIPLWVLHKNLDKREFDT